MKRVIAGRVYNTDTADHVCELPCSAFPGDFRYHDTDLYRTKNGNYFLAGSGGPMSMWAEPAMGGGTCGGKGIIPVDKDDAREHAEAAELSPEDMIDAGFELQDA